MGKKNKCVNGLEAVANAVAMCQSAAFRIGQKSPAYAFHLSAVEEVGMERTLHFWIYLFFLLKWGELPLGWGALPRVLIKERLLDSTHGDRFIPARVPLYQKLPDGTFIRERLQSDVSNGLFTVLHQKPSLPIDVFLVSIQILSQCCLCCITPGYNLSHF